MLEESTLTDLWQSGWAFKQAIVDTVVLRLEKKKSSAKNLVSISVDGQTYNRVARSFFANELAKIDYRNSEEDRQLARAIQQRSKPLGSLATVRAGVKMYEKGKGLPKQTQRTNERPTVLRDWNVSERVRVLYRGEDVGRYELAPPKEFVNYGPWLAAPRSPELFDSPKLLMRRTDDRLLACAELDSAICVNSCHVIKLNDLTAPTSSYFLLLGILNSKLLQRIFEIQNPQMVGKIFAEIKVIYVERLPICQAGPDKSADKDRHDRMVSLVERMLELHKQLAAAKTEYAKTNLQRQIDATDAQIDQLVYELYELTRTKSKSSKPLLDEACLNR